MMKPKHVLGISGGKDSAALAIYMKDNYPHLDIDYYFCDTGKELEETYTLIKNLEVYLGKPIEKLEAAEDSHLSPFDYFMKYKGRFLPSSFNRWCTQSLKLDPFEKWIGDKPVISYVGIRGDEDREGYISHKQNIQSIFPFRKNIWSEDVNSLVLKNENIEIITSLYISAENNEKQSRILETVRQPLSPRYTRSEKLADLLQLSTKLYNEVVFKFLKTTSYPLGKLDTYPVVSNEDVLVRDDIFRILIDSGVGVPKYYNKVEFEVDGQKASYSRSRSGCFFCFFQQRIEWVWLLEQHPELFKQAMEYEKEGYKWSQKESLQELMQPERVIQIKREYIKKLGRGDLKSPYLLDILDEAEGEGCAACFI